MELKDLFDEKGDLKDFDPYCNFDTDKRCKILFDEEGDLLSSVYNEIIELIKNNLFSNWSDAVALIYAHDFAMNTKGNYSAIYYWR